jgi:LysR family transcriptional activator of dmlA
VNATLGFGRTTIAPLVSAFAKRYPEVEVQMEVTDRPVDLVESGFDLAIRFGALPDKRPERAPHHVEPALPVRVAGYLERHGTPASLADLARHRCIIHRQNDDAYGIWRFSAQDHSEVVKVHGMLSSNDGDIVLGWALDGHGILMRSEWDLAKYLDSGRLRDRAAGVHAAVGRPVRVLPEPAQPGGRARAFIDFLVEHFHHAAL